MYLFLTELRKLTTLDLALKIPCEEYFVGFDSDKIHTGRPVARPSNLSESAHAAANSSRIFSRRFF